MSSIKNVILIGATGNLGILTLKAIQAEPSLNISILTRKTSSTPTNLPANTKVLTADYKSIDSLAAAFTGYDAVVCAVGMEAIPVQIQLIDAAIKAGVKRFIPAEYGIDAINLKLEILATKTKIRDHLQENSGKIEWTILSNGTFIDWGLKYGLLGFDIPARKAVIYDSGKNRFSCSTLSDVARGIVGILKHPDETKNKYLNIQTTVTTQLEILELFEKLTGTKWETKNTSTEGWEETVESEILKGDWSRSASILFRDGNTDAEFDRIDNEFLGVKQVGSEGLEEILKQHL